MIDLLRVTPHVTPSDRMRAGLASVHAGIADSRARIERLTRERDEEIATLVDVQHRLRAEAFAISRARRGRHLQVGEQEGPRARDRDGPRLAGQTVDKRTADSLALYGLAPREGDAVPTLDRLTIWGGIVRRLT